MDLFEFYLDLRVFLLVLGAPCLRRVLFFFVVCVMITLHHNVIINSVASGPAVAFASLSTLIATLIAAFMH